MARKGASEGARAVFPGFETLADGSTRLFVELSKPIQYETKSVPGALTYVLKDTGVDKRNNCNPLITVDFNTAVTSARLIPHGKDLWFSVMLRAKADPDVTLDPTKDGGVIMRVAFAKGDFLPKDAAEPKGPGPGGTEADPQADSEAGGGDAPPPPRHHHHPQQ